MSQLLTSTQAGQRLGKSARTVQRMAEAGEINFAHKLPGPNGAYLFTEDEVQRVAAEYAASQPESEGAA